MWKIIVNVRSYWEKCKRDNVRAFAAQAAFFIILSSIPFLMFLTTLLQYTPISEESLLRVIAETVPGYVEPFFVGIVDEVYTQNIGLLSVTAVLAIWAAGKAIQHMTAGFNAIHGIYETRNWLVVRFWSVIYTLAFILVLAIILSLFVFTDYLRGIVPDNLGLLSVIVRFQPLTRGLGIFVLLCLFFTVLFMALPNKKLSLSSQVPGAVICAAAWYIFSFFLNVYVSYFNGFSMYGSMTTIALLMLWLYVCMYIMFMCAEANIYFEELFGKWFGSLREKLYERRLRR